MQTLFDLLKFLAGLAVIAAIVRYLLTQGLPPRGKGRWRWYFDDREPGRRERHK